MSSRASIAFISLGLVERAAAPDSTVRRDSKRVIDILPCASLCEILSGERSDQVWQRQADVVCDNLDTAHKVKSPAAMLRGFLIS
jgi:hypothetical protein